MQYFHYEFMTKSGSQSLYSEKKRCNRSNNKVEETSLPQEMKLNHMKN